MAPKKRVTSKAIAEKATRKRKPSSQISAQSQRTLFAYVELRPKSLRDDISEAARTILTGNSALDPGLQASFYRQTAGDWLQAASDIVKLVKKRYRVKPIKSSEALAQHNKPVSAFISLVYGRVAK